jgi:HAE1 family hydrophobic/amphiphilic exporter-1
LVSFTVVPLLVSRFGKHEIVSASTWLGKLIHGFERTIDSFAGGITSLLVWAIQRKVITLVVAFALLAGAVGLIFGGFIGIEFIKGGDRGEFLVEIELPRGTPLSETDEVARQIEDYLAVQPEIAGIFTTVGITSAGRIELNSENLAELTVKLIGKEKREKSASVIAREIKLHLESILPGVKVRPIDINLLGLRDDDAVQVTVASADSEQVYQISQELAGALDSIRGTVEVTSSASVQSVETVIETDRALMVNLKVNPVMAGATLRTAVNGNQDQALKSEDGDVPVNIRLQGTDKRISDDLLNMSVFNEMGQLIQLNQFARIHEELSPGQLERTNRTPSVTIKSQVIGRTGGQVNSDFDRRIEEGNYPDDVYFISGGQTKRTQEGIITMLGAFAASILLVYFVLVILYNSFLYPFVVLFSIPMAMIGALLALALSMEALSIFSILGLVMLVGLVGKNAILVVDFTNRLRMEGVELGEALVQATRLRFRPVLMTNLSMIIGLIPIAIATGAGSEWKNGLAWVIIGGLSSSMLLTLIIVPVIYSLFSRGMKNVKVTSK